MTRKEAAQLVVLLAASFPSANVTEETSEVYEAMLGDLDFEIVKQAAARHVATSKWFPSVAELRAAALDVALGPRRTGLEGWGDVLAAIRRVGSYGTPKFDDPGVAEVVRMLGWVALCRGDNEASDRARFVELYESLQQRARLDAQAGHALPPARGLQALPSSTDRAAPQLPGRRRS